MKAAGQVTRQDALTVIGQVWAGSAMSDIWRAFNNGDYQTARDLAHAKVDAQNAPDSTLRA